MIRRMPVLLAAMLLAAGLAACAPTPAPDPAPPGFATEEEAFAAAEETYRAYVDALNAVDLSDPETFEGVYAWTTGDANAAARTSFSQMHADGWEVSGQTVVTQVDPLGEPRDQSFSLATCVNVSEVQLADRGGVSVVDVDRRDIQSMTAVLVHADTSPTRLLISTLSGREGAPEC